MKNRVALALVLGLTSFSAWACPEIAEKPIIYDAERAELMRAYLVSHNSPNQPEDPMVATTMKPKVVVLHWTAVGSLEGSFNAFNRVRIRGARSISKAGAVNVSVQYLVDRDGMIYRLMDETRMGRHTIGLNHISIGIENVGGGTEWPLTDAQVEANAILIRDLTRRHDITHVIGHHEYRQMEGHPYFQEIDPNYRTHKSDPGAEFMNQVRTRIQDLKLLGPPSKKSSAE